MRVWIMAMNDEGWILENKSRRFYGKSVNDLEVVLANLNKNEYILFSDNLKFLLRFFNEGGLMLRMDFRFSANHNKTINSIHYIGQNKNICFRPIQNFFGKFYRGSLDEILKGMWSDIDEFVKLSGIKDFYHRFSMDDIIRTDWRECVDWENNFKNKLTKAEFFELRNFARGGAKLLNKEFTKKIIRTSTYDANSCYQSIWEKYPIPIGKPIYDCEYDDCEYEHLKLITYRLSAKVKEGYFPILTHKQYNFDWQNVEAPKEEIIDEVCYSTYDEFKLVNDFYDVENLEIIKVYCFETYQGDGFKKFNERWEHIKHNTTNSTLKKNIKIYTNKIVGASISEKSINTNRILVDEIDGNSEFSTKKQKVGTQNIPYAPLYIFITDFARNIMFIIAQNFADYLVASNIDSLTFVDTLPQSEIESFIGEIDNKKLGAYKREAIGVESYYKSPTHYLRALSKDRPHEILAYKWSGKKDNSIFSMSLIDAVAKLEFEETNRTEPKAKKIKAKIKIPQLKEVKNEF